jgi:hypothetical protein
MSSDNLERNVDFPELRDLLLHQFLLKVKYQKTDETSSVELRVTRDRFATVKAVGLSSWFAYREWYLPAFVMSCEVTTTKVRYIENLPVWTHGRDQIEVPLMYLKLCHPTPERMHFLWVCHRAPQWGKVPLDVVRRVWSYLRGGTSEYRTLVKAENLKFTWYDPEEHEDCEGDDNEDNRHYNENDNDNAYKHHGIGCAEASEKEEGISAEEEDDEEWRIKSNKG